MSSSNLPAAIPPASSGLDVMTLGKILAASGYFGDAKEAGQAVVKILAGAELGFGPIASMTGIYIVKGKVTLSANLMAAAIKRHGRYNYRVKRLDGEGCEIEFTEAGQGVGVSTFTLADAKQAGLTGDNWRNYPRNMLFARALSNGAKWFCADIWGGPIYTPDELGERVDESGNVVETQASSPSGSPTPHITTPAPHTAAPATPANTTTVHSPIATNATTPPETPPADNPLTEAQQAVVTSHQAAYARCMTMVDLRDAWTGTYKAYLAKQIPLRVYEACERKKGERKLQIETLGAWRNRINDANDLSALAAVSTELAAARSSLPGSDYEYLQVHGKARFAQLTPKPQEATNAPD